MKQNSVLVLIFALALTGMAYAGGDPNYQLFSSSNAGPLGASVSVDITLNNLGGAIQGWSWGVCTGDPSVASVTAVVDGATTATVKGGLAPDFNQKTLLAGGWTVGVVISFIGTATLPGGAGYDMNTATYSLDSDPGAPGEITSLDFCNSLGMPPVATVIVVGGASIAPQTTSGQLEIVPVPPFTYTAPDASVGYNPMDGIASVSATISIEETGGSGTSNTQGFSMGLSHDGTLAQCVSLAPAGALAALGGGTGPAFFGTTISPTLSNGWTVGVVYSFVGGVFIQFTADTPVVTAGYSAVAGVLIGDTDGESTPLAWSSSLGTPPVANVVVVGGASIAVNGAGLADGSLTFIAINETPFIRSDCNDDGINDIADGIWILNNLFQGGPNGPCAEACDANDDDAYDQSDAVYVFNYQFLDGPPPPAPFPACGIVAACGPGCCDSSSCP